MVRPIGDSVDDPYLQAQLADFAEVDPERLRRNLEHGIAGAAAARAGDIAAEISPRRRRARRGRAEQPAPGRRRK